MVDDIRGVLRQHEALLVHFNTLMTRHPEGYPQDLRDAVANPDWRMCYSTILKTDVGPSHAPDPRKAVTCGSVGVVVDLQSTSLLISVHDSDSGSNGRTAANAIGSVPSVQACENSIVSRGEGHNEWFLSDARPIGIFSFPAPMVIETGNGERNYSLSSVADDFPGERIFTVSGGEFMELDRDAGQWVPRTYSEIIPA